MSDPFGDDETDLNAEALVLLALDESRALCFAPPRTDDGPARPCACPGADAEAAWRSQAGHVGGVPPATARGAGGGAGEADGGGVEVVSDEEGRGSPLGASPPAYAAGAAAAAAAAATTLEQFWDAQSRAEWRRPRDRRSSITDRDESDGA